MDKFIVKGPCKIKGEISISGSKNAALPILASTILSEKKVTIKNLPRVKDIDTKINLLKSLGSVIQFSKNKKNVKITKKKKQNYLATYSLVRTMSNEMNKYRGTKYYIKQINDWIINSNFKKNK